MSVQPLTTASCVFLVGMISCGVPSMLIADDITAGELQHCSAIDDGSLRLACYDKLGGRQAPAAIPAAPPPESAAVLPAVTPEPTVDDFGSGQGYALHQELTQKILFLFRQWPGMETSE